MTQYWWRGGMMRGDDHPCQRQFIQVHCTRSIYQCTEVVPLCTTMHASARAILLLVIVYERVIKSKSNSNCSLRNVYVVGASCSSDIAFLLWSDDSIVLLFTINRSWGMLDAMIVIIRRKWQKRWTDGREEAKWWLWDIESYGNRWYRIIRSTYSIDTILALIFLHDRYELCWSIVREHEMAFTVKFRIFS